MKFDLKLKKIQINLINNLVSGIVIIVLGLITIIGSTRMYTNVINLFVYIFIIYALSSLINFIFNKKIVRNKQVLTGIIINLILGIVMILLPEIPLAIFPIVFSIYLLFNAIVKFISYAILKENELKSRFKYLLLSIFFLLFSIIFLFYPLKELDLFISIIGLYCLVLGFNRLFEFIYDVVSDKFKLKIKKQMRISLPVFFEALLPRTYLNDLNKCIYYVTGQKDNKKSDLQIFIHVSKYGFNQFGHIDIRFEDKIYSYGNYDKSSERMFTSLGDGVMFELTDKEKYIQFCIENSKKTIIEYGLKLTNKQKENLKKKIENIKKDTYLWNPLKDLSEKDYARKLLAITHTKYYKFNKGVFKTYFVLGVNCTYFANQILKTGGSGVLKLAGIITPGTYFEYLEDEYRRKNGKVISRKVYNSENIGELYDKNKK